ncbi:MAG: hypothetical protein ACLQGV_19365 [Bryobacteraceae bacterium]
MKSLALPAAALHTVPTSDWELGNLRGRNIVKIIDLCSSLCILMATAAHPLAAQSMRIAANIPFEFTVGATTIPAGDYTVSNGIGTNVLIIGTRDGRAVANAVTVRRQTGNGNYPDTTKLMFRRYGNQYFLSELWSSDSPVGHQFPMSRTERELMKSAAVKPESVIVLAQGQRRGDRAAH